MNLKPNPNLKVVRFDKSAESIGEISQLFGAEIKREKDHFRLCYKCQVSPEDAAAGWTGGGASLLIRPGDYVVSHGRTPQVVEARHFEYFFEVQK